MLDFSKLNSKRIILASGSPRRHFLLKELGLNFEVMVSDVDETYPQNLQAEQIPLYLCQLKANAVSNELLNNHSIIISADTIVWMNGKVLNKPVNRDDAFRILSELSGKKHDVITGVCIKDIKQTITFTVLTEVFFRTLTSDEIYYYIDHYKPFDKAGAYGIQEWIGYIGVERINGSFHNVMGLPVTRLYEELQRFL